MLLWEPEAGAACVGSAAGAGVLEVGIAAGSAAGAGTTGAGVTGAGVGSGMGAGAGAGAGLSEQAAIMAKPASGKIWMKFRRVDAFCMGSSLVV